MEVKLRELSLNDGSDIYEMLQEMPKEENGFFNNGNGIDYRYFKEFLEGNIRFSKGIDLKPEHVPQTIYWLIVNGKPVGIGKFRSYLNENLRRLGGHIGYGIRPSERGKGYGILILKELLKKAEDQGIGKVLITCNSNNLLSKKVIESNGGKLEDVLEGTCRYWINIK